MMEQIAGHLKHSNRLLIATHENPDGDAISSLTAMGLALEKLDKSITLYNGSLIPAVYRFLPAVERITQTAGDMAEFDTAVVLDCADLTRVGDAADRIATIPRVINIDHHLSNTGFGDCRLVDPQACATTELIYRLLKTLGVSVDKDIATAIYTGILTDTGSFRFANTTQAAFAICMEMAQAGVNPFEVAQHVYGTYSLGRIKLLNLALDSIEISINGKLSMMTVTQKMLDQTGTQPEDADGLINYARRIEDVKVAALIQELRNGSAGGAQPRWRYHVSLRSDGTVDVATIAAAYGGGGHSSAAGFGIRGTLSEVKSEIAVLAEKL
jgi:phosphoesterase RecJ-like protein